MSSTSPSTPRIRAFAGRWSAGEGGFTLIEVLVAAVVLTVGLLALLGALDVASHANQSNRVRQQETSLAREVVENVRALGYPQLATPATIAAGIQPQLTLPGGAGATLNGSTLTVTRASSPTYTFTVSFTTCSMDDPSDGYGSHGSPPPSGGSWCPDVAAGGAGDTAPDDYKRVSVTVTPSGTQTTPTVQQTVMLYNRPTHGPAVACLSPSGSGCPGANQTYSDPSLTSLTFNVTTTAQASAVQWLVNGNPPSAGQMPAGNVDPYAPAGTASQFTWNLPQADGTYSITAVAFDSFGNSGTRSTIQITLNRHAVIAPANFNAGYDPLINGVDVQWSPSIDQDVRYYHVYHVYNGQTYAVSCLTASGTVTANVTGTSCTDTANMAVEAPPQNIACVFGTSYTTANSYYVEGVDTAQDGSLREGPPTSPSVDANLCDHSPSPPSNLNGSVSNGVLTLNWSAPGSPNDPDANDSVQQWRIYRWPAGQSVQYPGSRYQVVGYLNGSGGTVTTATDDSPDPSGVTQSYCVTAVDKELHESACSSPITR